MNKCGEIHCIGAVGHRLVDGDKHNTSTDWTVYAVA